VFHEQYTVDKGKATTREKGKIAASRLQNHNAPDAKSKYRYFTPEQVESSGLCRALWDIPQYASTYETTRPVSGEYMG